MLATRHREISAIPGRPIDRMRREQLLGLLIRRSTVWDFIIIGGGATGLGTAIEAASRGFKALLLERKDFAAGTSSRSSKLIHGGLRYLRQGRLALVRQALRERGLLLQNAPHLVRPIGCVIPLYKWWESSLYGCGVKCYDLLAGRSGLEPSQHLSRAETLALLPTLEPSRLRGGILYQDCVFNDARLAVNLAQTLLDLGGIPLNYLEVIGLLKAQGRVAGVEVLDRETGNGYELRARIVINATGVFTDRVRHLDEPGAPSLITPSQGAHLVLDGSILPGDCALVVPRTDDGRMMFAIPWRGRVLLGTTETPISQVMTEPRPLQEEIDFLLGHAGRFLSCRPVRENVSSVFAGLRPLVGPVKRGDSASLSRGHTILVSASGLVTIAGGKWTTYRRMAQDTVDRALSVAQWGGASSVTNRLRIHGWRNNLADDARSSYGADADALEELGDALPAGNELLHPRLPFRECEVVWAVRQEFARTIEDVLARRTGALFLDAEAGMAMAPRVAELMAAELGRDETWQQRQVDEFRSLARGYCMSS